MLSTKRKDRMLPIDEMYDAVPYQGGAARAHYEAYATWLSEQLPGVMRARREQAEMIFRRVGITFAVYGEMDESGSGTERLIPFDLIPRIIPAQEWAALEKGLVQRVTALNRFIHDVYHQREILRAGLVPEAQVLQNSQYRPEMQGVDVPMGRHLRCAGAPLRDHSASHRHGSLDGTHGAPV